MREIKTFLNSNNLTMNETKTTIVEVMVPQKRGKMKRQPPHLDTIGPDGKRKRIMAADHTRILGYNIQNNLAQQAHISSGEKHLLGELRAKLGAIKYLWRHLPKKCRKTLATGLIISIITYLTQVWGAATPNYLKKIQIILNNTAIYVTG